MTEYSDEEKHPYGPPSYVVRRIIDDPDRPVRTWLRDTIFFETNTGFCLLLVGFIFQLLGTWV